MWENIQGHNLDIYCLHSFDKHKIGISIRIYSNRRLIFKFDGTAEKVINDSNTTYTPKYNTT
jgi:hypothetical protein